MRAAGSRPRVGLVTGLRAEARIVARAAGPWGTDVAVVCAAANAARAEAAAEALAGEGVAALASIGLAGALDESLASGALLLPQRILRAGEAWDADPRWRERLVAAAGPAARAHGGPLAGSSDLILTPAEKRRLAAASGAIAVDMESAAVALVAARHGLPFVALRLVADRAGDRLPRAVAAAVGPDGRSRPLALALALLRQPATLGGELRDLLSLARLSGIGLARLRRLLGEPAVAEALFGGPGRG